MKKVFSFLLVLAVMTSVLPYSVYANFTPDFFEGFEVGTSGWISNAGTKAITSEKIFHNGKNSLVIDEPKEFVSYTMSQRSNKLLEMWIYDDMALNKEAVGNVSSSESRIIGIVTSQNSKNYVYRIGSKWFDSKIPRTFGWHKLGWDYSSGVELKLYIDGLLIGTDSGVKDFTTITIGDLWGSFAPGAYFDDITAKQIKTIDEKTGVSEKIELDFAGSTAGIINPEQAVAEINFLISGRETRFYTVNLTVMDLWNEIEVDKQSITVTVPQNIRKTQKIKLNNLKNGSYRLQMQILLGNTICKSYAIIFNVIPEYTPQFMESFTKYGVNVHPAMAGGESEMHSRLLKRSGIKALRDNIKWNDVEKVAGKYDFSLYDSWIYNRIKDGMPTLVSMAYGSTARKSKDPVESKYQPIFKDYIEAYCDYIEACLKHYPHIKSVEIWNEPNITKFWGPVTDISDYSNLVKAASFRIRKLNPEIEVLAGSPASADSKWIKGMFDNGAYPYIDTVSYHPYIYPAEVDKAYSKNLDGINKIILTYGGWKVPSITEIGWSTNTGSTGVSEESQAHQLVKQYIVGDSFGVKGNYFYNFRSKGTNLAGNEDMFGIIYADQSPKKAYFALTHFMRSLAGAVYVGKLEIADNTDAYVYMKDKKPTVVIWTKNGEYEYDFSNENVDISDMIGNPIDLEKITIGREPLYVKSGDYGWLNKVANEYITRKYDELINKWENKLAIENVEGLKDLKRAAEKLETLPDESALTAIIKKNYGIGGSVIESNLQFKEVEKSAFLYELHDISKIWCGIMLATVNNAEAVHSEEIKDSLKDLLSYNTLGSTAYSSAIANIANDYAVDTLAIRGIFTQNPAKPGIVKTYDLMAWELADWAVKMNRVEKPQNSAIFLQIPSIDKEVYAGLEKNTRVTVFNSTQESFKGILKLLDEEGNVLSEKNDIDVGANGNVTVELPVLFYEVPVDLNINYVIKLYNGDSEVAAKKLIYSMKERVNIELLPSYTTLNYINGVKFKVKNSFEKGISGKIEIEAPEGWEISGGAKSFSLNGFEEKEFKFDVITAKQVPFNIYTFNVTVMDDNKNRLLKKAIPLSFTTIVKQGTELSVNDFNGDISSWSEAYPIFINPPANANIKENWYGSDVSAMVYTKWDSKYLYILGNVHDNIFAQTNIEGNIWNGDSIQISIDGKESKSGGYDTDDYEYGIARTDLTTQFYAWHAATGQKSGKMPDEWAKIIIDNDKKLARYLIKIPKNMITPLSLTEKYKFGFNIAINDADFDSRERFVQFTKGTADKKDTKEYHTWEFVPSQNVIPITDEILRFLPIDVIMSDHIPLDHNTLNE